MIKIPRPTLLKIWRQDRLAVLSPISKRKGSRLLLQGTRQNFFDGVLIIFSWAVGRRVECPRGSMQLVRDISLREKEIGNHKTSHRDCPQH